MINYVKGDATAPQSEGVKIITHCCNNIGAWGAGFVLALSRRWPHVERAYKKLRAYNLGDVQFVQADDNIVVANIIGQDGISDGFLYNKTPIRYPAIEAGLVRVATQARMYNPHASIHMPRMGCGLAGGTWDQMEPIIAKTLDGLDVTVYDF